MKRLKIVCLIAIAAVLLISLVIYIPIWIEDAERRKNRERIMALISVGQNLGEAEQILRDSGFRLVYEEPINPTEIEGQSFSQLVIVGDTQHNAFETIGYATGASWMPFVRSGSAYVHIRANLDRIITEIE